MIRNAQVIQNYDFSGGINISVPAHLIGDDECCANISSFDGTKNCHWDNGVVMRGGTLKVNENATGSFLVNGIRVYRDASPSKTTIVAIDDGSATVKIYWLNGVAFDEIATGGAEINDGADIHLAVWKNALYVASGDKVLQKVTYAEAWAIADIVGLAYKPQFVCQHKDRLWVAGGDMPMGYLECSDYEDDTQWASGDGEAFNVGLRDGDPIKQLASLYDNLVIYKQDSIWMMKGDNLTNWFQHRNEKEVGCVASHSVADVGIGHIFLSIDNVYFFNGQTVIPIGNKIKPWLDLIPITYRGNAAATYHNGWYRLAFTSATYNNMELIFDVHLFQQTGKMTWWLNTGRNISEYAKYDGPGDDGTLYMCDSHTGFLREIDEGTQDDNVSYEMEFYSKHYSMGDPNLDKAYDRLKVDFSDYVESFYMTLIKGLGADLIGTYTFNTGASSNLWGTGYWGTMIWQAASMGRSQHELAIPAKFDGPTLAFKLRHPGNKTGVKFYGISLAWAPKVF